MNTAGFIDKVFMDKVLRGWIPAKKNRHFFCNCLIRFGRGAERLGQNLTFNRHVLPWIPSGRPSGRPQDIPQGPFRMHPRHPYVTMPPGHPRTSLTMPLRMLSCPSEWLQESARNTYICREKERDRERESERERETATDIRT